MGFWKRWFFHSPVRYIVALVINAVVALVVLSVRGFDLKIYYVDAFSAAGGVSVFFGLLLWVAAAGAFDTMGYGFSVIGGNRKYKDLYEYTVRKKEKRGRQKKTYMPYIVVGIIFLMISFLVSCLISV